MYISIRKITLLTKKSFLVVSRHGRNFVGAKAEWESRFKFLAKTEPELISLYANKWKFIPPNSPLFGDLWEEGVISMKHHMKRGKSLLVHEDFQAVLLLIEAVLNTRHLFLTSWDLNDLLHSSVSIRWSITAFLDSSLQQHIWNR